AQSRIPLSAEFRSSRRRIGRRRRCYRRRSTDERQQKGGGKKVPPGVGRSLRGVPFLGLQGFAGDTFVTCAATLRFFDARGWAARVSTSHLWRNQGEYTRPWICAVPSPRLWAGNRLRPTRGRRRQCRDRGN